MTNHIKLKSLLYSRCYRKYTRNKLAFVINCKISLNDYKRLPGTSLHGKIVRLMKKWNTKASQQN